ncbi:hypothetical protein ACH5RR_015906 [Cinchona calisaya]|uniref:Uncharacterized protein n=1 Tax=Cinchona calisaya TaxID=153742 RepID=A0ABD2ZX47_9GENT
MEGPNDDGHDDSEELKAQEEEKSNEKSMRGGGRERDEEMETGVLECHVWEYDWFQLLALPSTTTHIFRWCLKFGVGEFDEWLHLGIRLRRIMWNLMFEGLIDY